MSVQMQSTFTPINAPGSNCSLIRPSRDKHRRIRSDAETPNVDDAARNPKHRKKATACVNKVRKRAEGAAAIATQTTPRIVSDSLLPPMAYETGPVRQSFSIDTPISAVSNDPMALPGANMIQRTRSAREAFESFKVRKAATVIHLDAVEKKTGDIEPRPRLAMARGAELESLPPMANVWEPRRRREKCGHTSAGLGILSTEKALTTPVTQNGENLHVAIDDEFTEVDFMLHDVDELFWSDDELDSTLNLLDSTKSPGFDFSLDQHTSPQLALDSVVGFTYSTKTLSNAVRDHNLNGTSLSASRLERNIPLSRPGEDPGYTCEELEDHLPDQSLMDIVGRVPATLKSPTLREGAAFTQTSSIPESQHMFVERKESSLLDEAFTDLPTTAAFPSSYVEITKPIVRPPFPNPTRDRSSIAGLTSDTLLRVCFRVGEALNISCTAVRSGRNNIIIELYARVMSTSRNYELGKQAFVLGDLFHDRPPLLNAVYEGWKGVSPSDYDSAVFLEKPCGQLRHRMCRCMGRMRRENGEWLLDVQSIWEAGWEDVEHVRGIVCS